MYKRSTITVNYLPSLRTEPTTHRSRERFLPMIVIDPTHISMHGYMCYYGKNVFKLLNKTFKKHIQSHSFQDENSDIFGLLREGDSRGSRIPQSKHTLPSSLVSVYSWKRNTNMVYFTCSLKKEVYQHVCCRILNFVLSS